jgi:anti-repressor protein
MKTLPQGGAAKAEYYVMTKDGFSFLVMGYTGKAAGKFKEDFIDAFNKMDSIIKNGQHQVPTSFRDALLLAAQQQEQIEAQQKQLEAQRPAVVFRDSVTNADTHITVRELAKLICQNGVEVGERRLYDWLVENKYLIRHERYSQSQQRYVNSYYEPYQCHVNTGLFFTKETVVGEGNSSFIRKTVYITGKGQVYFINKFLMEKAA